MTRLLWTGRRLNGLALVMTALVAVALLPASGCKTETVPGECKGGEFDADGKCVAVCDDSKCKEGNVCVDNECRLVCTGHFDCLDELQECAEVTADSGAVLNACVETGRGRLNFYIGQGLPCPGGWECNAWGCSDGRVCYPGDPTCVAPDCSPVGYCPNGLQCDPGACGGDPASCTPLKKCEDGSCNLGTCSNAGHENQGCVVNTCAVAECKPMVCLRSADASTVTPGIPGEGDADAYCAIPDCVEDASCGPGYYCGVSRDAHDICGPTCAGGTCSNNGSQCTGDGNCQKGNSSFCGQTLSGETCADPAALNSGTAATFEEGSLCLLRAACRLRDECAPCTTNLDCSKGLGDVCVPFGAGNVCARWCAGDGNCRSDEACVFSGDDALGYVCLPRSGSCDAQEPEKFCHHCLDDKDCGDANSTWGCWNRDGETACMQMDFPVACSTNADCPVSPSGANGKCLDENDGVMPTDSIYHHCYLPPLPGGGYGCWP